MDPTPSPVVETRQLTKRFRRVTALDSLSLAVLPGQVYALLGANGSGKSTTFRLLLNIYRPSSGEAFLLGRPSSSLDGADFDKVAYLSEGQKLPAWMSVERFLTYCSGFYSDWDQALCDQLVDRFGLARKQKLKHLSRGQRMKACLASTLPARPRLLLLDEPFSGLDVETRASVSSLLKSLALDTGLAVLITTHDVEEVEPVATHLGILDRGRLEVNEALGDFLGRHRSLRLEGASVTELPEDLARRFRSPATALDGVAAFTDAFDGEFETTLLAGLPLGAEAKLAPMTLRQILVAGRQATT